VEEEEEGRRGKIGEEKKHRNTQLTT